MPSQSDNSLLAQVYTELRHLAGRRIADERPGFTLSATELVHEAYVRLVDTPARQAWDTQAHFFTAAAEAMRRILIERARRKQRIKHGRGRSHSPLLDHDIVCPAQSDDLLVLDEALTKFEAVHPDKARFVKLRYFTGMSIEEAAQVVLISRTTAHRYWVYARAWLHREMNQEG